MANSNMLDIAFDKVARASFRYNEMGYNRSYFQVYQHALRERLITDPDCQSVHSLVKFVNSWSNRTRYSTMPELLSILRRNTESNASLRTERLESPILRDSGLETVQAIFEDLCSVKHFGPTGASKFLGIIHPQLCVMWDEPIRKVLGYNKHGKVPSYSDFLRQMRILALEVSDDAAKRHGIADPAENISRKYGFDPPLTLATLVNHFVWVTITLPLQKKSR